MMIDISELRRVEDTYSETFEQRTIAGNEI